MMILKSIFITYIALISHVSISTCDPLTQPNITGFTIDLIHIDSPQSPSYDPSLSPYQRIANALRRSFNRAQRFKLNRTTQLSPQAEIINGGVEYLMKYSVGTPPVTSLGIADTGSDITWTQCQPCLKCFKQTLPVFNPKTSSTYRTIPCNTPNCNSFDETSCSKTKKNCLYTELYGDGSSTNGELATDTITLSSTDGKSVSVPNIIFGCGFSNSIVAAAGGSGIVGLGGGKASFVRQLGPLAQGKFSYCLVSSLERSRPSKLSFGTNAEVMGVSTPFVAKVTDTFYYLTLEGISVGNQNLAFSDSRTREDGNIIIDSGTTLMLLPSDFYAKLENAMKSSIKLRQIRDPQGVLSLCFFSRTDIQIPDVTVHFKGADVKLKQENLFVRTSDVSLCLGAQPVDDDAIYGNLAQVNFVVGYDLVKRTVSFQVTDCGRS